MQKTFSTKWFVFYFIIFAFAIVAQNTLAIADQTQTQNTFRTQKLELVDSETGDIYCMWMKKGLWQQSKGTCDSETARRLFGQAAGWSEAGSENLSSLVVLQNLVLSIQSQIDEINEKIASQQGQIIVSAPQSIEHEVQEEIVVQETTSETLTETVSQSDQPIIQEEQLPVSEPIMPEETNSAFEEIIESAGASLLNAGRAFLKAITWPFSFIFNKQ